MSGVAAQKGFTFQNWIIVGIIVQLLSEPQLLTNLDFITIEYHSPSNVTFESDIKVTFKDDKPGQLIEVKCRDESKGNVYLIEAIEKLVNYVTSSGYKGSFFLAVPSNTPESQKSFLKQLADVVTLDGCVKLFCKHVVNGSDSYKKRKQIAIDFYNVCDQYDWGDFGIPNPISTLKGFGTPKEDSIGLLKKAIKGSLLEIGKSKSSTNSTLFPEGCKISADHAVEIMFSRIQDMARKSSNKDRTISQETIVDLVSFVFEKTIWHCYSETPTNPLPDPNGDSFVIDWIKKRFVEERRSEPKSPDLLSEREEPLQYDE